MPSETFGEFENMLSITARYSAMLYCAALRCAVLCCAVLCCAVLCYCDIIPHTMKGSQMKKS